MVGSVHQKLHGVLYEGVGVGSGLRRDSRMKGSPKAMRCDTEKFQQ